MNAPVISVIVPVYNTSPWLRRCLDSICAQSYHLLEILCVNDGSTDNSAEILAEYALRDSRIKVFTQENAGLSAARNTGLENATGEWVTGVDSDDWLALTCIEQAAARIQPDVDIIFYGVQLVDENGCQCGLSSYFSLHDTDVEDITPKTVNGLNVCFWSKLWRRSIIEQYHLRFPVGLLNEDEAFFYISLPYARKMAFSHSIGYYYVQRAGSIMSKLNDGSMRQKAENYVAVAYYVYQQYGERELWFTPYRAYAEQMFNVFCEACFDVRELFLTCARLYFLNKRDYRIRRLVRVPWWISLFLTRYHRTEIYRFFKIPVICIEYNMDGSVNKKRIILFSWINNNLMRWVK